LIGKQTALALFGDLVRGPIPQINFLMNIRFFLALELTIVSFKMIKDKKYAGTSAAPRAHFLIRKTLMFNDFLIKLMHRFVDGMIPESAKSIEKPRTKIYIL